MSTVTYSSFAGAVTRTFVSRAQAVQWADKVGVLRIATITGPKD